MTELDSDKKNQFDFYGKKEEGKRLLDEKNKEEKFSKFKKMAITSIAIALSVTALATSSAFIYNNYQEGINQKIVAVETVVKQNPKENILNLIEKERNVVKKTFASNQLAINEYAKYKDLVDVLNLGGSLGIKNTNNSKLQKDSLQFLNADEKSINLVSSTITESRNKKIDVFLNGEDIKKYNKWSENVKTNNFMYVGGLINLNKEITKELSYLEDAKQDIIKTVNAKIKTKDYSLDVAQGAITKKLASDVASELNDLKNIRKEVKGTESDSILTDKDVSEAEDAMTALQSQATTKIKEDRSTVEAMIAKADTANQVPVQSTNQSASYNQTRQSSGGLTFMDYYLINHWMTAGSASSSYSSGYNAGVNNSLASNNNRPATPYVAAISNSSSNLYDFKKHDSYLNKSMDKSANFNANNLSKAGVLSSVDKMRSLNANKVDVGALRAKMEMAKTKSIQASNMRSASVGKANMSGSNSVAKSGSGFSGARTGGFSS